MDLATKSKNWCVLWSGGCDSTLALAQILDEAGPDDEVTAVSILHINIGAQLQQREARAALKRKLASTAKARFIHREIEWLSSDHQFPSSPGVSQALIWLASVVPWLRRGETLVTGHVRGDDFWHSCSEARAFFDAAISWGRRLYDSEGFVAPVWSIPLEWMSKADVVDALAKRGLLDLCWFCEEYTSAKPCGTCTPCRIHATARAKLADQRLIDAKASPEMKAVS